MSEIYFDRLRSLVIEYIDVIKAHEPESHSIEWFLMKYLTKIEKVSQTPAIPGEVEGSIRSLVRFYVDNIEENTELGDICTRVYNEYHKVLKEYQEHQSQ